MDDHFRDEPPTEVSRPHSKRQQPSATGLPRAHDLVVPDSPLRAGKLVPVSETSLFWKSCGGIDADGDSNPLRVAVGVSDDDVDLHHTWLFEQPVVLIGREEGCDLRLPGREVSRRHAYLQLIGGRWMCIDLGSSNGVRWPSGRHRHGWLEPGGAISIGPYHIHSLQEPRSPETSHGNALLSTRERPDVYLEFLNGRCTTGDVRRGWGIRHRVTLIGANDSCELQLEDPTVMNFHASLVLTTDALWFVNLTSLDRTGVNGRPFRWQRLETGDELQVGRFRMRVHFGQDAEVSPPPLMEPRVDRAPAPAPEPTPASGLSEDFVLRLMGQLAAMQQQFMEHSQQQMMLMTQMLANTRNLPAQPLAAELDRVEQLSQEIQQLKRQLANPQTPAPAPAPFSPAPFSPVQQGPGSHYPAHQGGAPNFLPASEPLHHVPPTSGASGEGQRGKRKVTVSDRNAMRSEPASPPVSSPIKSTAETPDPFLSDSLDGPPRGMFPSVTHNRLSNPAANGPANAAANAAPDQRPAGLPAADAAPASPVAPVPATSQHAIEMHASLLEGMARLEAERTSSWTKLVNAILGNNR